MFRYLSLLLLSSSFNLMSKEPPPLMVDRFVPNSVVWSFPNDSNVRPKQSEFEILHYAVMSNEKGERWSAITLVNTSSGTRQLEPEHMMALFADGSRISPRSKILNFKGNETQSVTVSFGEHKFPILAIYTSNSL